MAHFNVLKTVVEHTLPILLSFYLGAWSDYFGRKPLIYACQGGVVVGAVFAFVNAYFLEWRKEVFLWTSVLPEALVGNTDLNRCLYTPLSKLFVAGGYLAAILSNFSFIADNSKPGTQTLRLAIFTFFWNLAGPVATILGSVLFTEGGYVTVYATRLGLNMLGYLLFIARLWNFEEKIVTRRKEAEAKAGAKVVNLPKM